MKKINKFAAAIAVALSMGVTSQANAEIQFRPNGRGDALLFPVFNGYGENYFTIMNNHDAFIQGHLRFRGAAWSGELRDFDVILSPGDVFVFRVADIDGDGMWEIDQSLDIKNFQYTGLGGTPEKSGMDGWTCSPKINPDVKIPRCMDPSEELVPSAKDLAASLNKTIPEAQAIIDYHTHMGYVEFIGEAVLDGLDYNIMEILLGNNPGEWRRHQTTIFSRRGTNAWAWSDAPNKFTFDRKEEKDEGKAKRRSLECDLVAGKAAVCNGLSDVPNVLSGTAFLTVPGLSNGVAYNAEAFADFRTKDTDHRIDNYRMVGDVSLDEANPMRMAANRAVILHHEDAASASVGMSPVGDYIYQFVDNEWEDEAYMSFQNTWGPTLADGDDYNLSAGTGEIDDDFDMSPWRSETQIVKDGTGIDKTQTVWSFYNHGYGRRNSVAEVEEAIRTGLYHQGPQVFTSYYFDGDLFDKSCEGNGTKIAGSTVSFCPSTPLVRSKPDEPSSVARTTLTSYYFAFFPTKLFYGHTWGNGYYNKITFDMRTNQFLVKGTTRDVALLNSVSRLLRLAKPVGLEIWDTSENTDKAERKLDSSLSPALPAICSSASCTARVLGHELTFFSIRDVKGWLDPDEITKIMDFKSGRVVLTMANNNRGGTNEIDWPALMYTFEWDGDTTFGHWRPMHH